MPNSQRVINPMTHAKKRKIKSFKKRLLLANAKGFRDGWNAAVEAMTDNMPGMLGKILAPSTFTHE